MIVLEFCINCMSHTSRLVFLNCSIIFKSDIIPVMDYPFLSTSIKEFWSYRWNSMIQRCLKRVAFQPVIRYFSFREKKPTAFILMLATLNTFFLSALMHEWFIVSEI